VIARSPGQSFLRWVRGDGPGGFDEAPGLRARGYDGLGVVRAPEGRGIAYWSAGGPRLAVRAPVDYLRDGTVTTYALDAGAPAVRWGRLFVDACIPEETRVHARFLTAEDPDDPGALALAPPARQLHRRESGRELPWVRPSADDAFETYEAPIIAEPGRFLWVTLELSGNGRATPRVRSLRAERPGHDLVGRLPRSFSRDPAAGEFLERYLALADGLLSDLGGRSDQRAALISAAGAPAEALGWLAGFLGLVLDDRWPEAVRRRVIEEGPWLLRFRGTKPGLERLLELIVGRQVIILERWRLRGLAGARLEGRDPGPGAAVVGGGLRVGGAVGAAEAEPVDDDVFASHAHRFAVLVPALLTDEQVGMVTHALDLHRPAHTLFELCTLGSGMSVGRGLHLGLLSTIGRTGGFESIVTGRTPVGGGIVGRPAIGTTVGSASVGGDARVG
jgi:phage tail-like protein